MANNFFNHKEIDEVPESLITPIATPLKFLATVVVAFFTIVILHHYVNFITYFDLHKVFRCQESRHYNLILFVISMTMFFYMLLFIIRPSGHKPIKKIKEFKFIAIKLFYYCLSIIILFSIAHFLLNNQINEISFKTFNSSFHLAIIWLIFPFIFSFLLNRFFIDIPYHYFLKMHTHTLTNIDLFSATKNTTKHHTKDEIYIDVVQQAEIPTKPEAKKDYLKIQNMYLRLIKFWYAQKNYTFNLRYYFPLLISFGSLIYFFYILYFTHLLQANSCNQITGIDTMALIAISLSILYFTMSSHINNFLHSDFYTNSILKELNKIYFDKHDHRQQLKLFLDKNFLVYIHDKQHDNYFCVNESKDFQNFIFNKKGDEEGRNLIIMVYISFFMILFIETSTGDLLNISSDDNKTQCSYCNEPCPVQEKNKKKD